MYAQPTQTQANPNVPANDFSNVSVPAGSYPQTSWTLAGTQGPNSAAAPVADSGLQWVPPSTPVSNVNQNAADSYRSFSYQNPAPASRQEVPSQSTPVSVGYDANGNIVLTPSSSLVGGASVLSGALNSGEGMDASTLQRTEAGYLQRTDQVSSDGQPLYKVVAPAAAAPAAGAPAAAAPAAPAAPAASADSGEGAIVREMRAAREANDRRDDQIRTDNIQLRKDELAAGRTDSRNQMWTNILIPLATIGSQIYLQTRQESADRRRQEQLREDNLALMDAFATASGGGGGRRRGTASPSVWV